LFLQTHFLDNYPKKMQAGREAKPKESPAIAYSAC